MPHARRMTAAEEARFFAQLARYAENYRVDETSPPELVAYHARRGDRRARAIDLILELRRVADDGGDIPLVVDDLWRCARLPLTEGSPRERAAANVSARRWVLMVVDALAHVEGTVDRDDLEGLARQGLGLPARGLEVQADAAVSALLGCLPLWRKPAGTNRGRGPKWRAASALCAILGIDVSADRLAKDWTEMMTASRP